MHKTKNVNKTKHREATSNDALSGSDHEGSHPEMERMPTEMEANAQEAPDFKEAVAKAFLMREGEGWRRTR